MNRREFFDAVDMQPDEFFGRYRNYWTIRARRALQLFMEENHNQLDRDVFAALHGVIAAIPDALDPDKCEAWRQRIYEAWELGAARGLHLTTNMLLREVKGSFAPLADPVFIESIRAVPELLNI